MCISVNMVGAVMFLVFGFGLYNANKKFRYYTKIVSFSLACWVITTVFLPFMFLRPRDYRNALLPNWTLRQFSKCLGIKWQIRGTENIVQNSGCVILLNHQSILDMFVFAQIWPIMDRCTVISRREVFYLWPFGLAAWLWGTIFIDRLNAEKAQKTINETGETIRSQKFRLAMFPEGTRHGGDELLPFKKGAFHVAIASQTPIQPIVISRYYFYDSRTFKFDTGTSVIKVLPPIPTAGLAKTDIDKLIEKTYALMNESYKNLSQEVTSNFDTSINRSTSTNTGKSHYS